MKRLFGVRHSNSHPAATREADDEPEHLYSNVRPRDIADNAGSGNSEEVDGRVVRTRHLSAPSPKQEVAPHSRFQRQAGYPSYNSASANPQQGPFDRSDRPRESHSDKHPLWQQKRFFRDDATRSQSENISRRAPEESRGYDGYGSHQQQQAQYSSHQSEPLYEDYRRAIDSSSARENPSLQRRPSLSNKVPLGGLWHRHLGQSKDETPVRRRSSANSGPTEEDLVPVAGARGLQRHMSFTQGRKREETEPRDRSTPQTMPAQRAESRYIDGYDDAQYASERKTGTQDKMRRLVFGKRRAEGPKTFKSKAAVLDSEGESSGDESHDFVRPSSGRSSGQQPGLEDSWEHVPAEAPGSQRLSLTQLSEPTSQRSSAKAQEARNNKKRANFRVLTKMEKPDRDKSVSEQIHILCATEETIWEREQIHNLYAAVSQSDAAAKDAVQALRKELKDVRKHENNRHLSRAVKLWACLFVFSQGSYCFKLQVASKKFLDTLEELYHSDTTSAQTQGRLLVAWGMIARDSSARPELQAITRAFNKIKPEAMPMNGTKLDLQNDIFQIGEDNDTAYETEPVGRTLPSQEAYATRPRVAPTAPIEPQYLHAGNARAPKMAQDLSQQSSDYSPLAWAAGGADYSPYSHGPTPPVQQSQQVQQFKDVPAQLSDAERHQQALEEQERLHLEEQARLEEEGRLRAEQERQEQYLAQIARMHQECNVARSNAQVLTESLAEDGPGGAIVQEFGQKVGESQEFIASQIPWVSSQADESRQRRSEAAASSPESARHEPEPIERLMDDFLDAHEKVATATSMFEEAVQKKREEDEEARVIELSLREMRMDRSKLAYSTETGQLYDIDNPPSHDERVFHNDNFLSVAKSGQGQASSSRSPSPVRRPLPDPYSHSSSTFAGGPRPMTSGNHLTSASGTPQNYAPKPPPRLPRTSAGSTINGDSSRSAPPMHSGDGDKSEDIVTPLQPSEKALGKRRAVSIYEAPGGADGSVGSARIESDASDEAAYDRLLSRPPPALPVD